MTVKDEYLPESSIICIFLEKSILPSLAKISKENARRIQLSPYVMQRSLVVKTLDLIDVGDYADFLHGQMRLRFRLAFRGRILMHAECIFNKDEAISGCSGFRAKAEYNGDLVKGLAWIMHYSSWDWNGWV